jgi:hypothetical protein
MKGVNPWTAAAAPSRLRTPLGKLAGKVEAAANSFGYLSRAIFNDEQPGNQSLSICSYQHAVGNCYRLHACGDVGRIAEYVGFPY